MNSHALIFIQTLNEQKLFIHTIFLTLLMTMIIIRFLERPKNMEVKKKYEEWKNDPRNWVLGIFYHNPNDSRILGSKRFRSFGFTYNFANLYAKLIFFIVLILVLTYAYIFFTLE